MGRALVSVAEELVHVIRREPFVGVIDDAGQRIDGCDGEIQSIIVRDDLCRIDSRGGACATDRRDRLLGDAEGRSGRSHGRGGERVLISR